MTYQEFAERNNENKLRYSNLKKLSPNDPALKQASWRIHHVEPMRGTDYVQIDSNIVDYQSMRPTVRDLVIKIFSTPLFHVSNPSALRNYDWSRANYYINEMPDIFGH